MTPVTRFKFSDNEVWSKVAFSGVAVQLRDKKYTPFESPKRCLEFIENK